MLFEEGIKEPSCISCPCVPNLTDTKCSVRKLAAFLFEMKQDILEYSLLKCLQRHATQCENAAKCAAVPCLHCNSALKLERFFEGKGATPNRLQQHWAVCRACPIKQFKQAIQSQRSNETKDAKHSESKASQSRLRLDSKTARQQRVKSRSFVVSFRNLA